MLKMAMAQMPSVERQPAGGERVTRTILSELRHQPLYGVCIGSTHHLSHDNEEPACAIRTILAGRLPLGELGQWVADSFVERQIACRIA